MSRFIRKRPYVRAKMGMSLDGKIAMQSGESQWITSPTARTAVQKWRAQSSVILTTQQTVLADDCLLNVRDESVLEQIPKDIDFLQPKRLVLDNKLKMSPDAQIVSGKGGDVIVAVGRENVSDDIQTQWLSGVSSENVKCVSFPQETHNPNHIDFDSVLQYLAEIHINDVLVEAGPRFLSYLLENELVDELILHIAPDLLGGNTLAMQNLKINQLSDKIMGEFYQVQSLGRDIQAQVLISPYAKQAFKNINI
jgi:diaminohydroxyphosphoribosylaminopyrimidine deaminase/5-amino-6-(5-phosphoribosylamino)uracil reductase